MQNTIHHAAATTGETAMLNRRSFLKAAASAAVALSLPLPVMAAGGIYRPLRFYNIHTGERMVVDYTPGSYDGSVRSALEYFMRDFRTGDTHELDAQLFNTLCSIQKACGRQTSFEVISAYRSPQTNEFLRKTRSGIDSKSLHMKGRAIDIRVSELPTAMLRDLAIHLHNGGVGYYPESDFVHIDTGQRRHW